MAKLKIRTILAFCSIVFANAISAPCQSHQNVRIFSLGRIPDSLYLEGYYNEVLPYALTAVRAIQDTTSTDYAKAAFRLGELEYLAGRFKISEGNLRKGLAVFDRQKKVVDDTTASICNALILCLIQNTKWQEADSLLQTILARAEKDGIVSDYSRVAMQNTLGYVWHNQRRYPPADSLYQTTLKRLEENRQTNTEVYALALWRYGTLLILYERFEEGTALLYKAVETRTKIYGPDHPTTARIYNSIGFSYGQRYEPFKCRDAYMKGLEIYTQKLGRDFYFNSILHYNLACIYVDIGDDAQAEKHIQGSLDIIYKTSGKEQTEYPMFLAVLGVIKQRNGDWKAAERCFSESRDLRAKILNKNHPHYAQSNIYLANLKLDQGLPEVALPLLEEAMAVLTEIDGPAHTSLLYPLQLLAICKAQQGQYAAADSLLQVADHILEINFDRIGKKQAQNLEYKAFLKTIQGTATSDVELWLSKASKYRQSIINHAISYSSGRDLESLLHDLKRFNGVCFAAAKEHGLVGLAYDGVLFSKNLALQSQSAMREAIARENDQYVKQTYAEWTDLKRILVKEITNQTRSNILDSLEQMIALRERNLAGKLTSFKEELRMITYPEVVKTLGKSACSIEFVDYKKPSLTFTDEIEYAALILTPFNDSPYFIPLFKERQLSNLLARTGDQAENTTQLYAVRSGDLLDQVPAYGKELYTLIWRPLDSLLQKHCIKTVYFSPSGLLHRISFTALLVNEKKVLSDQYELHQLGSTRSLVVKTPEPVAQNYTAAVFGGVQYDRSGARTDSTASEITDNRLWAHMERPRATGGEDFDYLPGTAQEVRRLEKLLVQNKLRVQTHTGTKATEETLKTLGRDTVKSPDILHIATHGFFFPDPEKSKEQRFGEENAFKWNENPLFRSGLAMSGANAAWSGQPAPGNIEDGIATAYEISHLNLSNTKLVVLSACETGLGDIKGSEGVYGLQRAFKMAGVDYLLVSLWQVPDKETVEFMDLFYKSWLGGKTIHEAFAKAQKKMRKKYKEVYKWGAWVLME
jgi:CHAT domain-containing protein